MALTRLAYRLVGCAFAAASLLLNHGSQALAASDRDQKFESSFFCLLYVEKDNVINFKGAPHTLTEFVGALPTAPEGMPCLLYVGYDVTIFHSIKVQAVVKEAGYEVKAVLLRRNSK